MEAHCSESNNEAFNCGEADKYVQLALQAKMDSNTEQMWKYLKKALKLNPLLKESILASKSFLATNNSENETNSIPKDGESSPSSSEEEDLREPQLSVEQEQTLQRILSDDDLYNILGVSKDVDAAEILAAYRKAIKVVHPDKNNAPRAKEAAQKLNEASKILNNPAEREKYDAKRKREESSIITLLPSLAAVVLCAGGIAGLMYLLTRKDGTEKKGGKKGQNQ